MADAVAIWQGTLPEVMNNVTGRGVWAALNAVRPIALDENTLILGLPSSDAELAGHLRLPQTSRVIETFASRFANAQIRVRIIDGTTPEDYDRAKRRDVERKRLQEAEFTKMRAELQARTSWDTVYDQISRKFAAIPNKSLSQNRARFYDEVISLVAEARQGMTESDDMNERNFARCIERVAQYSDIPSTLVAVDILRRAGEL
jgi:hypothetical protein